MLTVSVINSIVHDYVYYECAIKELVQDTTEYVEGIDGCRGCPCSFSVDSVCMSQFRESVLC